MQIGFVGLGIMGRPMANNLMKAGHQLFVYGKRVDDFLAVDYDRIFTLSVGALQELSKQVQEQGDALRKSESRIRELEQKAARLTRKM